MLVRLVMRAQPDLAPPGSLRCYRPRDDPFDVGFPEARDKGSTRLSWSNRNRLTAAVTSGSVHVSTR